ncbi:MAG: hypothetical protein QM747_05415 [Nocardioides sp.]
MTEEPESPEIAEVRRLLAEARHTEPMPDDVVARLDDALAGLSRPVPESESDDPSDPLAKRRAARRRRQAAGWLVAAAAVVAGFVVVPHLHLQSTNSSAATADTAGGTEAGARQPDSLSASRSPLSGKVPSASAASGWALHVRDGRVVVRPDHFEDDVLNARATLQATPDSLQSELVGCAGVTGEGQAVAAEYDRAPAALVYRPAEGDSQVVDLYRCGDSQPVRSTTLPAP